MIAPDLRGLGDCSRPLTATTRRPSPTTSGGWSREAGVPVVLPGRPRLGGPTAYALAAAHPEAVRRLVILDVVIPGAAATSPRAAGAGTTVPHDARSSRGLGAGPRGLYLGWFYRTFGVRPDAIGRAISTSICAPTRSPAPCARASPFTARSRRTLPTTRRIVALQAADAGAGWRGSPKSGTSRPAKPPQPVTALTASTAAPSGRRSRARGRAG